MIYWQLYLTFFKVGLFSFGGGYASLNLIQEEVVNIHQWISMGEFTDLITISQMTPGPIAVNAATFVGAKIVGVTGGLVATLGAVTPSIIIVTILAWLYNKYQQLDSLQIVLTTLRPAIIAMILTSGVSIFVNSVWPDGVIQWAETSWLMIGIFAYCLFDLLHFKRNPIHTMILAGLLNVLVQSLII